MRNAIIIILVLLAVLIVAGFVGWHYFDDLKGISKNVQGAWSVVAFVFGLYVAAFGYLYKANPKFYMMYERAKMSFSVRSTLWLPHFSFRNGQKDNIEPEAIAATLSAALSLSVIVMSRSSSTCRLQVDGRYEFEVSIDDEDVHIQFPCKITVPTSSFEDRARELQIIVNAIEKLFIGTELDSTVTISFEKSDVNPYYGLFVRVIPSHLLKSFDVSYQLEKKSTCVVEADKDSVNIRGGNVTDVFNAVGQIITLQAVPAVIK